MDMNSLQHNDVVNSTMFRHTVRPFGAHFSAAHEEMLKKKRKYIMKQSVNGCVSFPDITIL